VSILLHHPCTSPALSTDLTWARADDDLWVADDAGAFARTIDRQGEHFFVRNAFGEYVGDYRTLGAGRTALAGHVGAMRTDGAC